MVLIAATLIVGCSERSLPADGGADMACVPAIICSAQCQYLCDAFAAGTATAAPPDDSIGTLTTAAVRADVQVHYDAPTGQPGGAYWLVMHGQLGDDSAWQELGVRLLRSSSGSPTTVADLGAVPRAPTIASPLVLDLTPYTACDFDSVGLYSRATGALVATTTLQPTSVEGEFWLCESAVLLTSSEMCGPADRANVMLGCRQ